MSNYKPMGLKSALLLSAAASLISGTAHAQSKAADPVELEPIIVTAERRETSLQTTPISVTALNADALEVRGVTDISDLAKYTPNMTFITSTGASGSRTAFVFLRGIGQSQVFLQNDPGVGTYIDGVYLGRTQGSVQEVLDLERVEILRGPQGTLYGRNTIGGAINLVSRKPDAAPGFEGSVEAGNFGAIKVRARANGPLADTLSASLSVAYLKHDGYVEAKSNPLCPTCTSEDLSGEDSISGRLALRWKPSEDLTIDLTADAAKRDDRSIGRRFAFYDAAADQQGYTFAVQRKLGVPPGAFVNTDINTHNSNIAGFDKQEVWGLSLTGTWDLGGATFKSITAYRELSVGSPSDGDGSPLMLQAARVAQIDQDQLSQEFQLTGTSFDDRFNWTVGLFGYREDATSNLVQYRRFAERGIFVPFPVPTVIDCYDRSRPLTSCPDQDPTPSALKVRNYAGYAHLSYEVTDQLSITGGLRYSWEKKEFVGTDFFGLPLALTDSWTSTTPKVGIDFQATPEVMVYGSYSEGFKSGSINNGNDPLIPTSVRPETVKAYELGVKSQWFDNRLRINAAIFRSDYRDQQLQVSTSNFTFAFINVSRSRISGGELEFVARPFSGLTIDGGIGYLRTEITKVGIATPAVRQGARLVQVPEWTVNLGATQIVPIGEMGDLTLRVDYSFTDTRENDYVNHPNVRVGSYSLVNLRATYAPSGSNWEFGVYGANILDEEYEVARTSIDPAWFAVAVDGAPRTYGVRIAVRY